MRSRAALLLIGLLAFPASARAAAYVSPAYDAKAVPLDELCVEMLTTNGYELRSDGTVWDKIGEGAVTRDDMPFLLSRLASARRLRALLEINAVINRYDAERKLTPEDKEAVRTIARKNWVVFGETPRRDFRGYFTVQEREELDKIAPRFERMAPITMTDPSVEVPEGAPAPAASITAAVPPAPPAPAVAAAPAKAIPSLTPLMEAPSLKRESPFGAPAAAPAAPPSPAPAAPAPSPAPAPAVVAAPAAPAATVAPVAAAAPPVVAPPPPVVAAPAPAVTAAPPVVTPPPAAPAPAAAAPAAVSAAPAAAPTFAAAPAAPPAVAVAEYAPPRATAPPVAAPELGVLKPWTPPAPAAPAAATVAAAPPPPPPAPEPPKPALIGAPEYEKFVAGGPYTKDGRALLELLGKRAPEYTLPLLRRTVVTAVPQVVVDGARTGAALRAAVVRDASSPTAPPIVALSPGPVLVAAKKGLFGAKHDVVLPESPSAWADLGVARPALDAFAADKTGAGAENGEWGAVRVYPDGSRRGAYSQIEQAGELLEQLLLLGLAREGFDASPYAARRWARAARLLFWARMKEELRQDGFLDPDRRAELRAWLDRPEEADDALAASWAGSRLQVLDPRRGGPEDERAFDARARASCARAALEEALVQAGRRRAARVGALETLTDAGVLDSGAAKGAAQAAADAETEARRRLLAAPPACPAADPARDAALRRAALLSAEAARVERAARERPPEARAL